MDEHLRPRPLALLLVVVAVVWVAGEASNHGGWFWVTVVVAPTAGVATWCTCSVEVSGRTFTRRTWRWERTYVIGPKSKVRFKWFNWSLVNKVPLPTGSIWIDDHHVFSPSWWSGGWKVARDSELISGTLSLHPLAFRQSIRDMVRGSWADDLPGRGDPKR